MDYHTDHYFISWINVNKQPSSVSFQPIFATVAKALELLAKQDGGANIY